MSLETVEREKEGILILDCHGRLTVGDSATVLRDRLRQLAAAGHTQIILNLAGVDYIDSTGLGILVICFTTLRKAGGGLRLLNVSRRAIELLVLTKLATVFELFDDEQNAINSFFPNRQVRHFDILNFVQHQGEE